MVADLWELAFERQWGRLLCFFGGGGGGFFFGGEGGWFTLVAMGKTDFWWPQGTPLIVKGSGL